MRKNKVINLSILILSFVMVLTFSLMALGIFNTKAANEGEFTYKLSADINDEYLRDSYFKVPTLTVKYDGNDFSADSKLTYPDNRESGNLNNYLDVEGEYVLSYNFDIGGKQYEKEYKFDVITGVSTMFESQKATFSVNQSAPGDINLDKEYNGVKVSTRYNNTVVEYKQPINLSDNTRDDVLFEFLAIPSTINIAESTRFVIKLTDTVDPDNWVKIRICHHAENNYYKAFCGANFKYGFAGSDPYNMIGYNPGNIYSGNGGLTAGFTMRNQSKKICANSFGYCKDYTLTSVKIYFDYYDRSIYAQPTALSNEVGDLDDVSQVGEGNKWNGFASDKAYLSIETNLTSSELNYLILNVDGQDMSDYKLEDNTPPEIKIDYKGNSESSLPYGLVGVPYKVFDAKCVDNLDAICYDPDVRVYSKTSYRNLIVDNGEFTPKEVGEHVIQYKAKDSRGNETIKKLTIDVKENYDNEILYEFSDQINDNYLVGEQLNVVGGSKSGGSGVLSMRYDLYKGTTLIEKDVDSHIFNQLGDYVLKATATDYLGHSKTFEKSITVSGNDYPVFAMPFITDYYVTGNTYYLPSVVANEYSKVLTGEQVAVDVYVDGVKLSNNAFSPTEEGEATITYKAVSKYDTSKYVEKSKVVKVIKPVGATFVSDYFYCNDNVVKTITDTNLIFTTNANEKISFINFLGINGFSVDFNVNDEKNNFEKISFYLTDANNPSLKLKISIGKGDSESSKTSKVYVNDLLFGAISGSFYGNVVNGFKLNFNQTEDGFSIIDVYGNTTIGVVNSTMYGQKFNGFNSDTIYFEFEFEGVTGESELILYSICNQMFNKSQAIDRTAPYIILDGDIETDMKVGQGETVVLPSARAYDVLTVNPILNLLITDSDGNKIYDGTAANGYSFVAEKYGTYSISYYAKDSSYKQNAIDLPYLCKVIDVIDPTIEFDQSKIPTAVYVGEEIKLPEITIEDNYSEEIYSSTRIYCPSGKVIVVEDNKFTLTEKGIHRIVIFACDEQGNSTMKTIIISAVAV